MAMLVTAVLWPDDELRADAPSVGTLALAPSDWLFSDSEFEPPVTPVLAAAALPTITATAPVAAAIAGAQASATLPTATNTAPVAGAAAGALAVAALQTIGTTAPAASASAGVAGPPPLASASLPAITARFPDGDALAGASAGALAREIPADIAVLFVAPSAWAGPSPSVSVAMPVARVRPRAPVAQVVVGNVAAPPDWTFTPRRQIGAPRGFYND